MTISVGKAIEVNADRKYRVELWRQLAINNDKLLATPTAMLALNVMAYIPLDLVGTV